MNPLIIQSVKLNQHLPDPGFSFSGFKASLTSTKGGYTMNTSSESIVDLTIDDDVVKQRTGFIGQDSMLIYIFIVCNGDVNVILSRSTSLTWFEEWFAHLEYKWGQTITRIWDGRKVFGISCKYFHAIVCRNYKIERGALESWPLYASHLEDKELRDPLWNIKYADVRVEELDMTDISAFGFSNPDLQRLTLASIYYNGNVLKGGVGVQLCGFIVAADLWPGGISDSEYHRR
jgi:hypothetical protein